MERRLAAAIILAAVLISWSLRFREAKREFLVLDGWTGEVIPASSYLAPVGSDFATITATAQVRSHIVSAAMLMFAMVLVAIAVWPARQHDPADKADAPSP